MATGLQPVILWFRQDLRLADHPALQAALATGAPVICLYVLDDVTPGAWAMGAASRWWLHHSLQSLSADLAKRGASLVLRRGPASDVLADLIAKTKASGVYFTRAHAPWAIEEEARVKSACDGAGTVCRRFAGSLLFEPEAIRTGSGGPYKVYSPFARACFAAPPPREPKPAPTNIPTMAAASDKLEAWKLLPTTPDWSQGFGMWQPGEARAHARLQLFLRERLGIYGEGRNFPNVHATSGLAAHLHFGEISPNQIWHATRAQLASLKGEHEKSGETFLKEVLWREFSYHLLHEWPGLPEHAFRPEYEAFPWREDAQALKAWQQGRTGYPIVDAGMRELWQTGTMHNRVRMIVASFLIKHLLLDWRHGQRWFWNTLVDADIASNAASWQWVAGSGADAAPYFRIFNPILQGEKFDGGGDYVRRFVPELAQLPASFIHKPWEAPAPLLREAGVTLGSNYPHPMVEHGFARERALAALKSLRQG
jgi:deoxyribodipyrimidine photo-lyase